MRLGLRGSGERSHLLQAALRTGRARPRSQKIVREVLGWPSQELRRAVRLGSATGNASTCRSALIRFPSEIFGHLPHREIQGLVVVGLGKGGGPRPSIEQFLVIANGGSPELRGTIPSLRTQHEAVAFHVLCNTVEGAESLQTDCQRQLAAAPSGVIPENADGAVAALKQMALAANGTFNRLSKVWPDSMVRGVLREFAAEVRQYLGSDDGRARLESATKKLLDQARWLCMTPWLPDVLHHRGQYEVIRDLAATASVLAAICGDQPSKEPLLHDAVREKAELLKSSVSSDLPGLTRLSIREYFDRHLREWYDEERVTVRVDEVHKRYAKVSVLRGDRLASSFRASVPIGALPDDPQPGDEYELVLWDLWHHWFGIAEARKIRAFKDKWRPQDRRRYIRRLESALESERRRGRRL